MYLILFKNLLKFVRFINCAPLAKIDSSILNEVILESACIDHGAGRAFILHSNGMLLSFLLLDFQFTLSNRWSLATSGRCICLHKNIRICDIIPFFSYQDI